MKIKIYGKLFEFDDADIEIIDNEQDTMDFSDIVALRREQHKHEVKNEEGMIWR